MVSVDKSSTPYCIVLVQVQLLVTASDVENYKQIKADLDELRNLVEKSELWVYKIKQEDSKKKHKSEGEDKVRAKTKWVDRVAAKNSQSDQLKDAIHTC